MLLISWTDVVNVFPGVVDVPEDAQVAILAEVEVTLESSQWGSRLALGQKWLAAHLAALYLQAASAGSSGLTLGPVTSESVGDVSRTYSVVSGASSGGSSTLDGTPFGQQYKRLQSSLLVARLGLVL